MTAQSSAIVREPASVFMPLSAQAVLDKVNQVATAIADGLPIDAATVEIALWIVIVLVVVYAVRMAWIAVMN